MSKRTTQAAILLSAAVALTLGGCQEYQVETALQPDGSGRRTMEARVEIDRQDAEEFVLADLRRLFHATAEEGWSYAPGESSAVETHIFRRADSLASARAWRGLSGAIQLRATVNDTSPYAAIVFANELAVERREEDGAALLTYRETFGWSGLVEAIIDHHLESQRVHLESRYPKLKGEALGEIFGMIKAYFWTAVRDGLFELKPRERVRRFAEISDQAIRQTGEILQRHYPGEDLEVFEDLIWDVFVQRDERDEAFFDEQLIGVEVSASTQFTLRLAMPGEVVRTNADRREEGMLVWTFSPTDALRGPIELVAEARLAP